MIHCYQRVRLISNGKCNLYLKQNLNKNTNTMNDQDYDYNIGGKFKPFQEAQSSSPGNSEDVLYKNKISFPRIQQRKREYGGSKRTEEFIREILANEDKTMRILQIQETPKNGARRSSTNTKAVRSQIVDLRKKCCGRIKCQICSPDDNCKSPQTHRKRRVLSLPDYEKNQEINRPIISKALQTHKKSNKSKITHVEQLKDGVFKLIPLEEKSAKPKKIKEFEESEAMGKTYFQEMKINGKAYLVKKKHKRISDLNNEVYLKNGILRNSSHRILHLSQAQGSPINNNSILYRINSQSRNYGEVERPTPSQDEKETQYQDGYKYVQLKRKKNDLQQSYKQLQREKEQREELNEEARFCIHRQTYYQQVEKQVKVKQEAFSPQRMALRTQIEDDTNIFQRTEDMKPIVFGNKDIEFNQDYFEKKRKTEEQKYSIKFPQLADINQSIKNYEPLTKHIDVFTLKKSPNFIREYSNVTGKEFLYFGQFDNSTKQKSGKGVLCTKNKVLEGIWKNGEIFQGAELKQNGIYRGFFLDGRKHGEGTYEWINGEKYFGEWQEGKRHGKGQWKSRKGDVYIGDWRAGKATGQGDYITKDEGTYRGQFKNFIKHGYGKHCLPNGDVYCGDFWEGVASGQGKYIWTDGLIYTGHFNDSIREGKGLLMKQGIFELEGEFKNDLPHGICRCKLANGDMFTGKYSYGDRSGYGNYEKKELQRESIVPISYWSSKLLKGKHLPFIHEEQR